MCWPRQGVVPLQTKHQLLQPHLSLLLLLHILNPSQELQIAPPNMEIPSIKEVLFCTACSLGKGEGGM